MGLFIKIRHTVFMAWQWEYSNRMGPFMVVRSSFNHIIMRHEIHTNILLSTGKTKNTVRLFDGYPNLLSTNEFSYSSTIRYHNISISAVLPDIKNNYNDYHSGGLNYKRYIFVM